MARLARIEFPGALYHVTTRGNCRQPIYREQADRELFLDTCTDVIERFGWRCHAYCLMRNHYHLVLETSEPNLSLGMHRLNGVYAKEFNRCYGRAGHLFESRYSALLVEREPHLLELARYVVLNPVRAGACRQPADWPWSSYQATAGLVAARPLLSVDWLLAQFGAEQADAYVRYKAFVADAPGWNLRHHLRGRNVIGSRSFARNHVPDSPRPDLAIRAA